MVMQFLLCRPHGLKRIIHMSYVAVLTSYMGKTDKIVPALSACRHRSIRFFRRISNESGKTLRLLKSYSFELRESAACGAGVGEAIMLERQKGSYFANIHDFVDRVDAVRQKRRLLKLLSRQN